MQRESLHLNDVTPQSVDVSLQLRSSSPLTQSFSLSHRQEIGMQRPSPHIISLAPQVRFSEKPYLNIYTFNIAALKSR